jgi:hypothetical protein
MAPTSLDIRLVGAAQADESPDELEMMPALERTDDADQPTGPARLDGTAANNNRASNFCGASRRTHSEP